MASLSAFGIVLSPRAVSRASSVIRSIDSWGMPFASGVNAPLNSLQRECSTGSGWDGGSELRCQSFLTLSLGLGQIIEVVVNVPLDSVRPASRGLRDRTYHSRFLLIWAEHFWCDESESSLNPFLPSRGKVRSIRVHRWLATGGSLITSYKQSALSAHHRASSSTITWEHFPLNLYPRNLPLHNQRTAIGFDV